MTSKTFLIAFLIAVMGAACANENDQSKSPSYDISSLVGRWEFFKAWRNGKQIETLTGTFYEFTADGTLKTNLTPMAMEASFPYSLSGNKIKQEGKSPMVYTIDTLSTDFLAMNMVIEEVPFRIELMKAQPPTEMEANDTTMKDTLKQL